jgi:hypothetical protein
MKEERKNLQEEVVSVGARRCRIAHSLLSESVFVLFHLSPCCLPYQAVFRVVVSCIECTLVRLRARKESKTGLRRFEGKRRNALFPASSTVDVRFRQEEDSL